MSAFQTMLRTDILPPGETGKRQRYRVVGAFVYHSDLIGRIEVPEGFLTDFASIPRILWRYLDPEDPCVLYPSVVHDYLYSAQPCSREVADKVFVEAMALAGARWDQRVAAYRAVRMFGGGHWKEI